MRKLGATLLAVPVLALVYLAVLGRAGMARVSAGVGAGVVIAIVVLAGLPPATSNAVPTSAKPQPVEARLLDAVATGHGLTQPFRVEFGAPMDAATVAAALRMQPEAAVTFSWDGAGEVLTIAPVGQWQPDTLYTLTVSKAARAADGGALSDAVRSVVLTEKAASGTIAATRATGARVRLDTAFRIHLDRPATLAAVQAALRSDPPIVGAVTIGKATNEFLFTPAAPLRVSGTYSVSLDGLVDTAGVAFGEIPALTVRTSGAASVVRFRPRDGQKDIERNSAISVRFSQAMDKARTAKAFRVTAAGKTVKGTLSWAENGRVLVFAPASLLPYGSTVVASVAATAASKGGAPIAESAKGTFKVVAKPKRAAATPAKTKSRSKSIPRTGGGGAATGSWSGVERYYLRLMNCTRTGGWVTSGGSCKSLYDRKVSPLSLNSGISTHVSRPYAKLLATRGLCDHFVGGTPGDRLRRAGYTSYRWGENLGCRSGNPYSAVLGSHLYFQSEKPYNGGHYRNLMDARFHQVGIGVWVSSGRVRLVIDFYTP